MKRIAITGANGFIGMNLCRQLQERGLYVRALLREPVQGPWDETGVMVLGQSFADSLLQGIDLVIHLAGKAHALSEMRQDEMEYFRINTEGTQRLLEAAATCGVRRFVFISSVKAMGEGEAAVCLDEASACNPTMPYGRSKLEAERLVLEGGYVPEPVVLRPSMVYGSTRKGNLPRMIEAVSKGRFPPLPEVGNRRSMVHVEDVVQAVLLVSERSEAVGNTYIVTDGQTYSTRQIYEWICDALNRRVPAWNFPLGAMKLLASIGDGIGRVHGRRFIFNSDVLERLTDSAWYSSERITRDLGFHAYRQLKDSLPEIIRFLERM